jgi:ATP-dependent RNA helicase DeaD
MNPFADLGLEPLILKALEKMGYQEPSPVQAKAIPLILAGHDLIALAQTGSGKTAACAIPVANRVRVNESQIQALILVPTRELALQYAIEAQKIGAIKGVKAFAIYGGEDASMQLSKLKHGVHVLVATPGRLIDFIYSRSIDLTGVETLILDEADEMLSMGFYDDIEFIIQCLVHPHQTLLFSATMPEGIRRIAQGHMQNPQEVVLQREVTTPANINHQFVFCRHADRQQTLIDVMRTLNPQGQSIVFCRSRIQVEEVCRFLKRQFPAIDYLHAGLSQDLRSVITSKFRSGRIRTLVATDVAARGLDFAGVTHVFVYQLSPDVDKHVHRSGRTGRYEREGTVISLVTSRDMALLDEITQKIGHAPKWIGEGPKVDQTPGGRHHGTQTKNSGFRRKPAR